MSKEKIYIPIFISFIPCILIFPSAAFIGGYTAVKLCLDTIIPSLFAFMVLSETAILFLSQKKLPFCILSKILKVDACCESAIILSFLGGYPVGVRCISVLYENKQISKGDARRLSLCLINPSPTFVISAIGGKMLSSVRAGLIIAFSVYFANIILSLGMVFFKDLYFFSDTDTVSAKKEPAFNQGFSGTLVNSVKSCSEAILYICMFTVFFGTVTGVLSALFKNPYIISAVSCLLEVTIGCKTLTDCGILSPAIFSFAVCFSGGCVILQILCFGKDLGILAVHCIATRFIASLIAFFIAFSLSYLYNPAISVFSNVSESVSPQSDYGFFSSILVMCAAAIFIKAVSKPPKRV